VNVAVVVGLVVAIYVLASTGRLRRLGLGGSLS